MTSHGATRIFLAAAVRIFNAIMMQVLGMLILPSFSVMAQQAAPEIPFESVPDPLKLPPEELSLNLGDVKGQAAAV
jgi:hypothetical protein